jgi:hypothetical protein
MPNDATPDQDANAPKLVVSVSYDSTTAAVIAFAHPVLTLVCDNAHPPGRPLVLRGHINDTDLALEGKTIGSKRREDARFTVQLRLTSLRREARRVLESLFS